MSGDTLALVLDELLPGGEGFPPASAICLATWLRGRAEFSAAADAVLGALPAAFAAAAAAERLAALQAIEATEAFGRLLVGAYSGYYVHPVVLAVIASRTSYPARSPQPQGHTLPPFNPALDIMRRRPRGYRDA